MAGHRIATVVAVAGILAGLQGAAWAMATRTTGPSLLVVPGRHIPVLKVGFDLLESRNTVLVAYQQSPQRSDPVLHVWNGNEWVPISMQGYESLSFLRVPPAEVVLVGTDEAIPRSLAVASWQDQHHFKVQHVSTHQTAGLLNELGRIFHFSRREWEWYAARYGLEISDANQAMRGKSFYDGGPLVKPGAPSREGSGPLTPIISGGTGPEFGPRTLEPASGRGSPPEAVVERESMNLPESAPPSTPGMRSQPPVQ
jgi:hypothetical protein